MSTKNSAFKNIILNLSSTKLFWWLAIFAAILFYVAMFMLKKGVDNGAFSTLNNQLFLDWIREPADSHPMVAKWVKLVFMCFAVLALNMLSRIYLELEQLVILGKKSFASGPAGSPLFFFRKVSVFFIHVCFVLMLSFYCISSLTGIKFQGEVLQKGNTIAHDALPFDLECVEVKTSSQTGIAPTVILKEAGADESAAFRLPAWRKGIFYGVNRVKIVDENGGDETQSAKKQSKTELRLFVHQFSRGYFIAAMTLWLASFVFFILLRPREKTSLHDPMGE